MFSAGNLSLSSLKKNKFIIEHILWDFEPKQLMQPRCGKAGEGSGSAAPSSGYILYIETMEKKPGLFLMIQNAAGYAETFAKISDVPDDLITEAVRENKSKEYSKMYPINNRLKEWLKTELGVTE
jgi:hypothetical protein